MNTKNYSVPNLFTSLSKGELDTVLSNTEALSDLLVRFKNLAEDNKIYYGAWKNNELIGFVAIINEDSQTPEVQIEIAPKFQGQGYGYTFLFVLLKYLFETKRYQYFGYTVMPTNRASLRLVEKLGAKRQPPKSAAEDLLIHTYHISVFPDA